MEMGRKMRYDLAGQTFGEYFVVGFESGKGWLCRCSCGTEKYLNATNLVAGDHTRCHACKMASWTPEEQARRGAKRRQGTDPTLTYQGAHWRVRRDRGSAKDYICACGAPATDWAYQHDDPDERISTSARHNGVHYSIHPEHYTAMCHSCHVLLDALHPA